MLEEQQSLIVRTLARVLVPFVQLFGLYVIVHGHSSPGGGFQGGVILGSAPSCWRSPTASTRCAAAFRSPP